MGYLKQAPEKIIVWGGPHTVTLQLEHAMKQGHSVLIPNQGIFNFLSSSVEICTRPLTA